MQRWIALREDVTALDAQRAALRADTDGQVLTGLPGVAVMRAAASAAHTLPIDRGPRPEHLYSATGLAPASLPIRLRDAARPDQPPRAGRAPATP